MTGLLTELQQRIYNRLKGYLIRRLTFPPMKLNDNEQDHDQSEMIIIHNDRIICVVKAITGGSYGVRLGFKALDDVTLKAARNLTYEEKKLLTVFHNKTSCTARDEDELWKKDSASKTTGSPSPCASTFQDKQMKQHTD